MDRLRFGAAPQFQAPQSPQSPAPETEPAAAIVVGGERAVTRFDTNAETVCCIRAARRPRCAAAPNQPTADQQQFHPTPCSSAPQRIRTSDLRLRRPTLYPAELVAQTLILIGTFASPRGSGGPRSATGWGNWKAETADARSRRCNRLLRVPIPPPGAAHRSSTAPQGRHVPAGLRLAGGRVSSA